MKLSVIITCYNFEAVIVRCIDSVVKQLDDAYNADVEVIVVDDVSKDASVSVISDYIARFSDRNIRLVCREQNGGVCAAKNTGLSVAKGEYLWILDGDDYISDGSLAVVLKAMSDYPDEEIITFDARFHYLDELVVEKRDMPVSKSISGIDFFKKNYVVCPWRNIISASYLKKHNILFTDGVVPDDVEFGLKLFGYAERITYVPESIYEYIIQKTSITNKFNERKPYSLFAVVDSAIKLYEYKKDRCFLKFAADIANMIWTCDCPMMNKTQKSDYIKAVEANKAHLVFCLNNSGSLFAKAEALFLNFSVSLFLNMVVSYKRLF